MTGQMILLTMGLALCLAPATMTESCDPNQLLAKLKVNMMAAEVSLNDKLDTACAEPGIQALDLGSQPNDWKAIKLINDLVFVNGGELFPHGVVYTERVGGLPVPGNTTVAVLTKVIADMTKQGADMKIRICSKDGQKILNRVMSKVVQKDDPPPHRYFVAHCDAVKDFFNPEASHCQLTLAATRVMILNLPAILKLLSPARASAIIEVMSQLATFGNHTLGS